MFGGQGNEGSLGDTWVFDGAAWRQEHTAQTPAARADAGMAFDPKLRALVLFGGWATGNGADLSATWLWTGHAWQERSTSTFPVGIDDQTVLQQDHMAYDAVTGKVILVGIASELEYQPCSTETWTFDGGNWQLQHPSTELPASETAIVDESQTGHVLAVLTAREAVDNVRGGQSCPVGSSAARALPSSSTWRWTGSTWVEVSTGSEPDAGVNGDAGITEESLQTVAGTSMLATGPVEALWSWNGSRWSRIVSSSVLPPQTWSNVQAADGDHVVLFGGADLLSGPNTAETWLWSDSRWAQVATPDDATGSLTSAPATQNPDVVTPAAP
jgi:hypothetical protein